NQIAAARGAGPDGTWELRKDNGDWKVASLNPPVAADRLVVQGLLRPWADLRAEKFAAYGPQTDWAKYGLDRSANTITVTVGGTNESHTLTIGRPIDVASGGTSAARDAHYARLDSRPGVVVLPGALARELARSPLDLVDRTLFAFDPSELAAIRRTGQAGPLELTRAEDGWQVGVPAAAGRPSGPKAGQPGLGGVGRRLGGGRAGRGGAPGAEDLSQIRAGRPAGGG